MKDTTNHGAPVPETSATGATFAGIAEPMPKYPIDEKTLADLEKRFTYHAPQADQPARYVLLRTVGKLLARKIVENTPKSREQSLALTHLEEALFWANAGIARNE